MLQDYVPVLLHVLVAIGFATVTLLANLLPRSRGDPHGDQRHSL